MPRLIETVSRTGMLVTAVNHLLAEGGPRALTLRAVAAASRVSDSSIIHHFGSVEHLLRVSVHHTGQARVQRMRERWADEGVAAHLPGCPDDVVEARTWLAWCELWRSHESLEPTIGEARWAERALLAQQLDFRLAPDELDALVALIDGLNVATCAPVDPMRTAWAATLLSRQLRSRLLAVG